MAESSEKHEIPGPRPGRLGNLLQIKPKAHITWTEWCAEYGPICKVNLGSSMGDGIVLGTIEVLRQALEEHDDVFSGRFVLPIVKKDGTIGTMTWENGEVFDKRREMLTTVMKEVDLEKLASNEAVAFCEVLDKSKDTSSDLVYRLIDEANLNMISTFSFRRQQRCPYDDPKFGELKSRITNMNKKLKNLMAEPANLFPALWTFYFGFRRTRSCLRSFVSRELKEHKETTNSSSVQDLMDGYLAKVGGIEFPANESLSHIMNLMGATITLKNALQWLILFITKHPEVQSKIQNEVTAALGENSPKMEDSAKLPYTNATIYEMLRHACPAAQLVPHVAKTDVNFHNYDIHKDTVVFGNLWGPHHDANYWTDPDKFNPDRFLDSEGNLDLDKKSYIPFGLGKRRCPGETYAKNVMFLFLANIYKRYGFEAVDGEALPDVADGMIYVGLHNPPPYKLKIVPR